MKPASLLPAAVALASFVAGGLAYYWFWSGDDGAIDAAVEQAIELHSIPLSGLDGGQTLLGDWRAEILVVNFWAPWCAPCRREIPALIEVQRQYAARGVRILGIAFDNAEQVRRFAEEYGIDYPLFLAGNRSAMYNAALNNPSGSLPYTALLDRDLQIVFQHNGELQAETLRTQLETRLAPPG